MKKPPPPPPLYIDKIRDMPPGTYMLFKGANPDTIKSIASRVGKIERRKYATKADKAGVHVWRREQ